MKKFLIILGVVVLLLVIAGGLVVMFGLNAAVKAGVEKGGSHVLKTEVTLDSVKLSPFSGKGTLGGLRIKNPEGFTAGDAFVLDKVHVSLKPSSLLSDKIVIKEVMVDGPVITYNQALTKSNIGQLKKNIDAFVGEDKKAEQKPEEKPVEKDEGKQITLEHFVLKNGKVSLTSNLVKGKSVTVALPRIELKNIGTDEKKASPAEVVKKVYTAILEAVVQAVNQSDAVLQAGGEALKQLSDQAGEIGGALESTGDKAKDTADSVTEGIRGLLGGDKDK
ncbi:MAG: AsmA family protein [Lentisphaeria bacterium]